MDILVSKYSTEECRTTILPALTQILKITVPLILAVGFLIQAYFPPPPNSAGNLVSVFLICIAATSFASFNLYAIILSKEKKFSDMALARLLRSGVAIAAQLAFVFIGKAYFLFVGEIVGRVTGFIYVRQSVGKCKKGNWKSFVQIFKEHRSLILYGFPAQVINSAALNLYPIILASSYPAKLVGVYFIVHKMVATPVTLIAQSISLALMGDIGKHLPHNKKAVWAEIIKVFIILLPLGALFFSLLWLGIDKFSGVIFGPGWEGTSDIVLLLMPLLILQFSTTPFSQLLNLLGRSRSQLTWDAARLVLVVVSIVGPSMLVAKPEIAFQYTLAIHSFGSAALYILHMILIRNALTGK